MSVASSARLVAGLTAVTCAASNGLYTVLHVATACVYLSLSRLVMSFKCCSCRCLAIIHVTSCYQHQLILSSEHRFIPRVKAQLSLDTTQDLASKDQAVTNASQVSPLQHRLESGMLGPCTAHSLDLPDRCSGTLKHSRQWLCFPVSCILDPGAQYTSTKVRAPVDFLPEVLMCTMV